MAAYSLQANGNIPTCAFIKADTGDNLAVQAGAGDPTIGISSEGAQQAPYGATNSTLAAAAGDQFEWFAEGETCYLLAGSGGWTAGAFLKSDSGGLGVVTTTDKEWYGAIAITPASAGEKGMVRVQGGFMAA